MAVRELPGLHVSMLRLCVVPYDDRERFVLSLVEPPHLGVIACHRDDDNSFRNRLR